MSSGAEDQFRIRGQLWLADLRFRGGRPLFPNVFSYLRDVSVSHPIRCSLLISCIRGSSGDSPGAGSHGLPWMLPDVRPMTFEAGRFS